MELFTLRSTALLASVKLQINVEALQILYKVVIIIIIIIIIINHL